MANLWTMTPFVGVTHDQFNYNVVLPIKLSLAALDKTIWQIPPTLLINDYNKSQLRVF